MGAEVAQARITRNAPGGRNGDASRLSKIEYPSHPLSRSQHCHRKARRKAGDTNQRSERSDSHRYDTQEFGNAIIDSVQNGDGALFGASLPLSLQAAGEGNLAAMTATTTSIGIDSVRKDYQEAQNRADQLDGQLAMVAKDWSGNFGEEAVQQGIQSYRDAHGADYDSAATQAQRPSSTLAGAISQRH